MCHRYQQRGEQSDLNELMSLIWELDKFTDEFGVLLSVLGHAGQYRRLLTAGVRQALTPVLRVVVHSLLDVVERTDHNVTEQRHHFVVLSAPDHTVTFSWNISIAQLRTMLHCTLAAIDVINVFYVLYSGHVFYVFKVLFILSTFFIFKNIVKCKV